MKRALTILLLFASPLLLAQQENVENTNIDQTDEALEKRVIEEVQEEPVDPGFTGSGASPRLQKRTYSTLKRNLAVLFCTVLVSAFCLNQVGNNPGRPASSS